MRTAGKKNEIVVEHQGNFSMGTYVSQQKASIQRRNRVVKKLSNWRLISATREYICSTKSVAWRSFASQCNTVTNEISGIREIFCIRLHERAESLAEFSCSVVRFLKKSSGKLFSNLFLPFYVALCKNDVIYSIFLFQRIDNNIVRTIISRETWASCCLS